MITKEQIVRYIQEMPAYPKDDGMARKIDEAMFDSMKIVLHALVINWPMFGKVTLNFQASTLVNANVERSVKPV